MFHQFTTAQLAEGWRFGIWMNRLNGQPPGGYLRRDGKVVRFESAEVAHNTLLSLGFSESVGDGKWPGKRPTAYVCQVAPDVRDEILAPTGLKPRGGISASSSGSKRKAAQ